MSNFNYCFIKNEGKIIRIDFSDLIYIKTEDYLSTFCLRGDREVSCTRSLAIISNALPSFFIAVNRNYIVNYTVIIEIKTKDRKIILENNKEVIISHKKLKELIKLIKENCIII